MVKLDTELMVFTWLWHPMAHLHYHHYKVMANMDIAERRYLRMEELL